MLLVICIGLSIFWVAMTCVGYLDFGWPALVVSAALWLLTAGWSLIEIKKSGVNAYGGVTRKELEQAGLWFHLNWMFGSNMRENGRVAGFVFSLFMLTWFGFTSLVYGDGD